MVRPRHEHPTPGELEVLQIIWDQGPSTVRQVMEVLNRKRRRHYTSVMSLLNVMVDKGYLQRVRRGRAFVYEPAVGREKTLGELVQDLLCRAFGGSATSLVSRLLDESPLGPKELDEIRALLEKHKRQRRED